MKVSEDPSHTGDNLIATAVLLGMVLTGDEVSGFWSRTADGTSVGNFYNKRTIAARWLRMSGYRFDDNGDVTLESK